MALYYYIRKSTFYSDNGKRYDVYLLDKTAVANTNILFDVTNVKVQYNNDEGERMSPIISSELSLKYIVDNLTDLNLMNSIASSSGGRYYISMYKDSNLEYFGAIEPGNFSIQDISFPYEHDITVTDGLKYLKLEPYGQPATLSTFNPNTRENLKDIIIRMLNKISDFYAGNDYKMLRTAIDWYSLEHPTRDELIDPLEYTSVYSLVFAAFNQEESGVFQGSASSYAQIDWDSISAYDVLASICSRFNARLFFANGIYNIAQVSNYKNASIFTRYWTGYGEFFTSDTETVLDSNISRLSDGIFTYYSAVKSVSQKILNVFNTDLILYETKPYQLDIWSTNFVKSYPLITGDGLILSGFQGFWFNPSYRPAGINDANLIYKLYVIGTTKSLGQDSAGKLEWKSNTTSYATVVTSKMLNNSYNIASFFQNKFSFELPDLLEDGQLTIKVELSGYINDGDPVGTVRTIPANWIIKKNSRAYLVYQEQNGRLSSTYKYTVNGSLSKYNYDFQDQILGDNVQDQFNNVAPWGLLYVTDDLTNYTPSTGWYDGAGKFSSTNIYRLSSLDFLYDQSANVRKYIGGFIGNSSFFNSVNFDNNEWLFISGSFDYDNDQWECEMFAIDKSVKTVNITDVSEDNILGSGITLEELSGELTDTVNKASVSRINSSITTTHDEITGSLLTSISVNTITESILQSGDVIIIEHPDSVNILELTVAATQSASATSITVQEFTPSVDYPIGCTVRFKGDLLSRMVKHKKEGTIAGAVVDSDKIESATATINFTDGNFSFDGGEYDLNNLPTSDSGLPTGRLYRDSEGRIYVKL